MIEIRMAEELVNVVIPAFNAAAFLRDALRSVGAQSHRPLQVVVVDDGSPDATSEVAESCRDELAAAGVDLLLLRHPQNQGGAQALRTGFEAAGAPYVCWLSADDTFVEPRKISHQLAFMQHTRCAVSFYRSFWSGESLAARTLIEPHWFRGMTSLADRFIEAVPERTLCALWTANPVNGSSTMFDREAYLRVGGFDPILRNVDADGDLLMRVLISGQCVRGIEGAPVFYRVHPGQTTQSDARMRVGTEATRIRVIRGLAAGGRLPHILLRGGLLYAGCTVSRGSVRFPAAMAELWDALGSILCASQTVARLLGKERTFVEVIERSRCEAAALADSPVWKDFAERFGLVDRRRNTYERGHAAS